MATIFSFTGHRPDKLGGYSPQAQTQLVKFANKTIKYMIHKYDGDISCIVGMALGWDQAVALACIENNIPFKAYIPFKGQESAWTASAQKEYHRILNYIGPQNVMYVCEPGYESWKMQERNKAMVDDSNILVALWNGSPGGTANCVRYANDIERKVVNIWNSWHKFYMAHIA